LVDEGGFTLDPSKAREKLRAYQLVNAHAYVLLMVEAAWIAGQAPINISCGPTTIAEFNGVSLTRSQLENVFTSVFLDTSELTGAALAAGRVQQMLGIAANAALSLSPARIEIENVDAQGRRNRMSVETDGSFRCVAIGEGTRGRTRFAFHGAGQADREAQEVGLIRRRCRYASFAVNLYGNRVSAGPRQALLGLRTERVRLDDGTIIGLAGIRPEREPATLLLVTRGVLAESVAIEGGEPGLLAVVDVDLRKDLSQQGVMRGEGFDGVMRGVMRANSSLTPRS
jgi:hypothetical protein